jgi:hypothetical protein
MLGSDGFFVSLPYHHTLQNVPVVGFSPSEFAL